MTIIFISTNSTNVDSGLNWSVPSHVKAQEKIDSVLWINLIPNVIQEHWKDIKAYHNIIEFGDSLIFENLPNPFNKPDVVIFEGFYYVQHFKLSRKLKKSKIPYIIVPRSCLTTNAFHNGGVLKYLKKKIAHVLFFNSYIKHSKGIQYLTKKEQHDSSKFRNKSFISPNGITIPTKQKASFSEDGIKAIFIGRQDLNQKGIDILLRAIHSIKRELRSIGFKLEIFGPPRLDYKIICSMIDDLDISDIVINNGVGINGAKKEQKLLDSDLFILTSRFEGMPMGLLEALSYGLPVLITKGTNMSDEVLNYDAGWCCDTSEEDIINTLKLIINERFELPLKGKNARLLATKYDWDIIAQRFHDDLLNILSN